MKRGSTLARKKPMSRGKPKKAIHDYMVDNGFVSASTLQPLPKLPPIPKRKPSRPKTTKARQEAKGKPCMIRLPGCDGGGETTVLCHYRLSGYCGTGMKPPDTMGSWGCMSCHSICDGRKPRPEGFTRNDVLLAFAEGVMRTQELNRNET